MVKQVIFSFFVFLWALIPYIAAGQTWRIEVHLDQGAGKEVYLANYYLGNIYARDTVLLDGKGHGVFEGDSLLPQGLYKIFLDKDHHFDFLLGADQEFTLKNPSFSPETLEAKGSDETRVFVEYTRFLKDLQEQGAALKAGMPGADESTKKKLEEKMEELTEKLHQYRDDIGKKHPGSFLAKFVKANYVPAFDASTLPKAVQENDTLLAGARFDYQLAHYWDHFDYTDERFLYTPFFKQKLETWFTKVLYQQYDSVRPYVMALIEEVQPYKRIFQFVTSYLLSSSANSQIMGMDALFVDIARKYYLSGEAFWAGKETMEKVRENVLFWENNLIGMTAPDLTLEGLNGEYHTLHQIDAIYTLVLIYEPGCSHCNEFVPQLYSDVYLPFRDKGLEVFAIYSMDNKKAWGDFIGKHHLTEWINVWDEHHLSRFKILYDGRTTPGLYVLDRNKKIMAKKINVEQVKQFLEVKLN